MMIRPSTLPRRMTAAALIGLCLLWPVGATADYITGQCVSCPQCPPCSGGGAGGGGSGSGRGVPYLLYLIFGDAILPKTEPDRPPPPPKPKYPEALRAFDRVEAEAKAHLKSKLIRLRPDQTFGAKMVTQSLVTSAGTAVFSNPGGADPRFAPNPPNLELKVPSGPRVKISGSVEQLGYAMAITRLANTTSGLSIEDQRFLLDQAGLMVTGDTVQLDLSMVRGEAVTADDREAIKELFDLKQRHRENRVEIMQRLDQTSKESLPYDQRRDDLIRAAGDDPEYYPDPLPDTPQFRKADAAVADLTSVYERFLKKDADLRREYREKAETVLNENPTVKFHFDTAIIPARATEPRASGKSQSPLGSTH